LIVFKKSPPERREDARAALSFEDVAYSWTFFGLSLAGLQGGARLARYLHLLVHSNLMPYHALLTSAQFGVERPTLLLQDFLRFPVVPLDELSRAEGAQIESLSGALMRGAEVDWARIDAWAAGIYGLSDYDQEVIRDTLLTSLPYPSVRERALRRPEQEEQAEFACRLQAELMTLLEPLGRSVRVRSLSRPASEPWLFLQLDSVCGSEAPSPPGPVPLGEFLQIADEEGASQIIVERRTPGSFLIGILAQSRYWTRSRARLLAADLLYEHEHALLGGARARAK
jgi:hypothetical protein